MKDVSKAGPVHLVADADTGDLFLIYSTDRGIKIELRYQGDAFWMTQAQIADLFGRDVSVISRHVSNILGEGELPEEGNLQKVQIGSASRPTTIYSLDMVISVGYRVSSTQGTMFRKWATEKLVQFGVKGFVVDAERLKSPESQDRVAELRDIIRDIRADEANVYRELRRICAMCQDYDGGSEVWRAFYQKTQAKLMWAVVSQTPSEVVLGRANAKVPNMGMQTWPNQEIRKQDTEVAKNYLTQSEIRELNRLTTILLDIFEDQLDLGRLTTMVQAEALLDQQLRSLNRAVLKTGGRVSSTAAKAHAAVQYAAFNEARRALRHSQADEALAALKQQEKALPKGSRKSRKAN